MQKKQVREDVRMGVALLVHRNLVFCLATSCGCNSNVDSDIVSEFSAPVESNAKYKLPPQPISIWKLFPSARHMDTLRDWRCNEDRGKYLCHSSTLGWGTWSSLRRRCQYHDSTPYRTNRHHLDVFFLVFDVTKLF